MHKMVYLKSSSFWNDIKRIIVEEGKIASNKLEV